MRESTVRVGLVYPELLGTYGDRGNALVLAQRCAWRGIPAEVVEIAAGDPIVAARRLDSDEVHIVASYTQFSALYRKYGTTS